MKKNRDLGFSQKVWKQNPQEILKQDMNTQYYVPNSTFLITESKLYFI